MKSAYQIIRRPVMCIEQSGEFLPGSTPNSSMAEQPLTPAQIKTLEGLLRAGFRFLTLERYARYLAVEKNGFVALLDPAGGRLTIFSQAGYLMGDGLGMLVEEFAGKSFIFHGQKIAATPELLTAYQDFKRELNKLLNAAQGRA